MRKFAVAAVFILLLWAQSLAKHRDAPPPTTFALARHTFIDVGPPFDFYELFVVQPAASGASVQRITVTPPGDSCTQPATLKIASTSVEKSVASLMGNKNPCAIPEKELRRERKRCKNCARFSGADVTMQFKCSHTERVIRADILDRDMFDRVASPPENTAWTMQVLEGLEEPTGPGPLDAAIFQEPTTTELKPEAVDRVLLDSIALGRYDGLFKDAPDKFSDLVLKGMNSHIPTPTVELVSAVPFQPSSISKPAYPPIAKAARVEGIVVLKLRIDSEGKVVSANPESGHPMLKGSAADAATQWRFPEGAGGREVRASLDFNLNCPSAK